MKFRKPAGRYNIAVQYFDTRLGVSQYALKRNDETLAQWKADDILPPAAIDWHYDGQTSTRFTLHNVLLHPGDRLEIVGIPDLQVHLERFENSRAPHGSVDGGVFLGKTPLGVPTPGYSKSGTAVAGGEGSASQLGENKRSGVMPELAPIDYLEFGPAGPITPQ
jgi:hypothetical protein